MGKTKDSCPPLSPSFQTSLPRDLRPARVSDSSYIPTVAHECLRRAVRPWGCDGPPATGLEVPKAQVPKTAEPPMSSQTCPCSDTGPFKEGGSVHQAPCRPHSPGLSADELGFHSERGGGGRTTSESGRGGGAVGGTGQGEGIERQVGHPPACSLTYISHPHPKGQASPCCVGGWAKGQKARGKM